MTTPIEVAALALEALLWEPDATEETRARAVFESIDREELAWEAANVLAGYHGSDEAEEHEPEAGDVADAIIAHLTGADQ